MLRSMWRGQRTTWRFRFCPSTWVPEHNPSGLEAGASAHWAILLAFIKKFKGKYKQAKWTSRQHYSLKCLYVKHMESWQCSSMLSYMPVMHPELNATYHKTYQSTYAPRWVLRIWDYLFMIIRIISPMRFIVDNILKEKSN